MLQQQIMLKQLEELQRQQKLQELNNLRQQNVLNQQSLIHNKQLPGLQYAPLINGTPVRDASQMFMLGNTNLVHGYQSGLPYTQAQNQVLHSTGLASQPVDEHSFSRPFHFQGTSRKSTGEQVDIISRSCMSDQFYASYQDRNMFGPALSQTEVDQHESGKGQEQDIINPSQESTSLDPLERKFLFDTDDDNLGGFQNMFEDLDNMQSFPSIQSGSWSALMQSTLEETSSTDTGVQEEWSGLSFQKPELSNDNQLSSLMESGKTLTPLQNNIIHMTSSLKASDASLSFPGFQQSHKETGDFEATAQVQRFSPIQVHQGPCGHAGGSESVNDARNNDREFNKGFLTDYQRHSKASDVTSLRSSDSSGLSAIMDKSAGISAPDLNSQTSNHSDSAPMNKMPKAENADAFTPSNNTSFPQYVGLMLGPPTQRSSVNYFDLSQISQQADIPSQQNHSVVQFLKAPRGSPSTSGGVTVSRIETDSEAPKESDSQMHVKGGNDLLEASGCMLNSQAFDGTRGQEGKIPFEQEYISRTQISPLNPNIGAAVRNEKPDSDNKVPQLTSSSQLTSANENYKTILMPTVRDGQLLKNSSILPQDAYGNNSSMQMNLASTGQYGRVWPVTGSSLPAINQDLLVPQSKKRKLPAYEFLPWHKETTQGSSRLQDMSTAEVEWAQAAKRIPEKLKEEAEALGESMFHSKKRIILTTQLMQVLFRPAPAAVLSEDANICYNSLTYFAARLALADACSLSNHIYMPCHMPDSLSGKTTISKGSGDQNLSKIVEGFTNRAKELENELLRLENRGSVLEIRMESQDLERFSVINRFARFHSRAQMVAAEAASSGGPSTVPKLYPQRYVKASPMPMIVPQGYNCLSL